MQPLSSPYGCPSYPVAPAAGAAVAPARTRPPSILSALRLRGSIIPVVQSFKALSFCAVCTLALGSPAIRAQATTPSGDTPAVKLPADRRALEAAKAETDPAQKLTSLQQFLKDYPDSKLVISAHKAMFATLVASFPQREKDIRKEGDFQIKRAGDPVDKAVVENQLAYTLAEAGANGVALHTAEKWAKSALDITEDQSNAAFRAVESKDDPYTPERLHTIYTEQREGRLQTLAEIYLHQGRLADAKQTADAAFALKHDDGSVYDTLGMIALAQHDPATALKDLELASVYGGITDRSSKALLALYRDAHNGADTGLQPDLDNLYARIYPPAALPAHPPVNAGHTVLVELFTGAGCEPCVAADLAVDDVLRTYPASQVIALEYDQHIPKPDPLTSPDGVERAHYDGVQFTPWLVLDGTPRDLKGMGGARADGSSRYTRLVQAIDAELPANYNVSLTLTASSSPSGTITANASAVVSNAGAITTALQATAERNQADADELIKQAGEVRTSKLARGSAEISDVFQPPAPAGTPQLVLNMALAQDDVRYAGENGIRFHRMVVRALAKPPAAASPVALSGSTAATATFDTAALTTTLSAYLDDYAKNNKRFGPITFLSTDTSLPPDHLNVVAWVENAATHQVVQAAIAPVTPAASARVIQP